MALQKTKTLKNGLDVSYWRIYRINHVAGDNSSVYLVGYKNKTVRDGDVEAYAESIQFEILIPKQNFIDGNVYEYAYEKITESKPIIVDEEEIESNWFADAETV